MKEKIIYIVSFTAAFVLVTVGIIYLNTVYKDIFHLDFTVVKTEKPKSVITVSDTTNVKMGELKSFFQQELRNYVLDSLKAYVGPAKIDTIINQVVKDSTLIDSLKYLSEALNKKDTELARQYKLTKTLKENISSQPDSLYLEWKKKTAKLYETMDPSKAAKIIQGYSDNVARDLIYTMKQKKAAEVLAEFSPENANRIMRAK